MLSSNMLLLNLILLIDVTFSTPTPVNIKHPSGARETSLIHADYFRACPLIRPWAVRSKRWTVCSWQGMSVIAFGRSVSYPSSNSRIGLVADFPLPIPLC
jgi:hypothetical protein